MLVHQIQPFVSRLVVGSLLGSFWLTPAFAQPVLNRASIYKTVNKVQLSPRSRGRWIPVKVGNVLVPQDTLMTAARSRAELLFNEGSLARTGPGTLFRFAPGKRRFELINGIALIMIRPGRGGGVVRTSVATITAKGTALWIRHDSARKITFVGALTSNPAGPVTVCAGYCSDQFKLESDVTVELNPGQLVSVVNQEIGPIQDFNLQTFYQACTLSTGLGPGQEEVAQELPEVQETLNMVRTEALAAWTEQSIRPQGLPTDFDPSLCSPKAELPGKPFAK